MSARVDELIDRYWNCRRDYERLRAAVVTVVDAEFGDDVPAIRQVLLDALDDECEVEFVEAMERMPESAIQESPVPGSSGTAAGIADALRGVEAAVWEWECNDWIDEQDAIDQRRVLLQAINVLMGRDRNNGLSPRVEVSRGTTEAGRPPTPESAPAPGSPGGGMDG